jgi:excisionase family DNA binding protein
MSNDFTMFKDTDKLDEYLVKRWNKCKKGINDCILIITGLERSGKTTLAHRILYGLEPGQLWDGEKAIINDTLVNGSTYLNWLATSNKRIGIFDEAGTSLYSREAMNTTNKSINKKLMVCGYKNLFQILCLPSFFDLDTNVRNRRLSALIFITEQGKFLAYDRMSAIKIGRAKSWKVARPCSRGWFRIKPDTDEFKAIMTKYREMEKKEKDKYMSEGLDFKSPLEDCIGTTEASKKLNVSQNTIISWIKNNKIQSFKIGKSYKIPINEVRKLSKI